MPRSETIHPIICQNDLAVIISKIEEYLNEDRIVKGIKLVDQTDEQVVLLISEEPIDQKMADIWWSGFNAFLGAQ